MAVASTDWRTVSVLVRAQVAGYIDPMRRATQVTRDFHGEMRNAARAGHLDEVAGMAGRLGLALVAAGGLAVAAGARFESAMSQVEAATGAAGAELESLSAAALQAGKDTVFSASEAAGGITELAKAGLSTADILGGGLTGALNLAAAGQISVADAAEVASAAMTQFKLTGRDVSHVADLLAAGAGKALGGVSDMTMALKQAGLVASQTGLSIEETTATLSAFAAAGLLGSDAGTSLRTMLLRLSAPTDEAATLMRDLGIEAYDARGQFIGMEAWAGRLRSGLAHMSDEQRNATLATIFGSDAIRAATVLYAEGADGVADWTEKVDDAGFAARQAAILQDNLRGDVEKLTGSLETLLIQGSGVNDVLRFMAQRAGDVVDNISTLPTWIIGTGTGVGLLTGALALGTVAWIKYNAAVGKATTQMAAAGMVSTATAGKMAAAGRALGALGAVIGVGIAVWSLIPKQASLAERMMRGPVDGIASQLGVLGSTFEETIANVNAALSTMDAAESLQLVEQAAREAGVPVEMLAEVLPDYARAQEAAAAESDRLASSTENVARSMIAAIEPGQKLVDLWDQIHGAAKTADEKMLDAVEAVNAVGDAFRENGSKIDGNSEAALRNRVALEEAARLAYDAADAQAVLGVAAGETAQMVEDLKQEAIDNAVAMGANREAVTELIEELWKLPESVTTTVKVNLQVASKLAAGASGSGQLGVRVTASPVFLAAGGIEGAANGLVRGQAGMTRRPILWGEARVPEAYVPSGGDRRRALSILGTAAGWHGADVVPRNAWYGTAPAGSGISSGAGGGGASGVGGYGVGGDTISVAAVFGTETIEARSVRVQRQHEWRDRVGRRPGHGAGANW